MMKRTGRVLADRYHSHPLRTPSEVRRAVAYVRDNHIPLPGARTWLLRTALAPPGARAR